MNEMFNYKAPLFKNERTTVERVEKFISKDYFKDCNLRGRLYGQSYPVNVKHCDFGLDIVTFDEAVEALSVRGVEVDVGFKYGPTWTTHWFQVDISLPQNCSKGTKLVLRFDPNCEALLWSVDGQPIKGLSPDFGHTDLAISVFPIVQRFYIEASCSDRSGDGDGNPLGPVKMDKLFEVLIGSLKRCELAEYNSTIHDLIIDFELLLEMSKMLPKEGARRYQALYTANDMINCLVVSNFSLNAQIQCHSQAKKFFGQPNGANQMTLYAMGNCHIDTAWLWRYRETRRKCARSWSATLRLMEKYKAMKFVVSQAQQLVWLKEYYPSLYEDMQDLAADGRFVAVGGAWVEMDGNLPSGESMIRQLLYGQREFKKFCGVFSEIFWLPDTFGYSAQLPQIMDHCGMEYFVTQKMSWSIVNKFPHHSFRWVGIDGTDVIAHFPPNHYVSQITVKECLDSRDNFTDHGRSNIAMMLYGFGDGGGGPNKDMLERAERLANCDGVPRVQHATPQEFFMELVKDVDNLCSWKGELYLELHNATYTTQARIKKLNRLLESILKDHEFLQSMSLLESNDGKPLTSQWQRFLLNQFHDVLPGSCIKEVVADAVEIYTILLDELAADSGKQLKWKGESYEATPNEWVINSCSWPRILFHSNRLLRLEPFSIVRLNELELYKLSSSNIPLASADGVELRLQNRYITASIDKMGRVTKLLVHSRSEESNLDGNFSAISENNFANQFVIFDDVPLFWDAWDVMDYHMETRKVIDSDSQIILVKNTSMEASIRVEFAISERSSLVQYISIFAHLPYLIFDVTVQWHESHKFLKVEFPANVDNMDAYYDIQFGHVKRPTHRNTSWDAAKYEVVGHKWMALNEFDRGIALLNDCKYGHSCIGNTMTLSLLRASKIPDDTADIGEHRFSYALYPFIGSMQRPCNDLNLSVMRAAYEFNNPIRFVNGWHAKNKLSSFLEIDGSEGIVIDTVKPAEDDINTLVIRLFESFGGGVSVKLRINHSRIVSVDSGDGLERTLSSLPIETNDSSTQNQCQGFVNLDFRAFEVKTLLLRLFALNKSC
uniref:alpha-mannosidase n=1 Tax=Elaeophora elaphi TaxID=1147741 RepID=A0A0R3S005_9BILA